MPSALQLRKAEKGANGGMRRDRIFASSTSSLMREKRKMVFDITDCDIEIPSGMLSRFRRNLVSR
jgi:hypothetical protein